MIENPAEQSHEIHVDATAALARFTAYRDREANGTTERIFFHTEVGGLRRPRTRHDARAAALDDVNSRGLVVVGVCPLVAAFLKKHPDYVEKAHPVTPEVLALLDSALG